MRKSGHWDHKDIHPEASLHSFQCQYMNMYYNILSVDITGAGCQLIKYCNTYTIMNVSINNL